MRQQTALTRWVESWNRAGLGTGLGIILLLVLAACSDAELKRGVQALATDLPVTLSSEAKQVSPRLFGLNNGTTIRGVARDDKAYTDALKHLHPGTLRFPGGTSANYWDWEKADFVCDAGGSYLLLNVGERPCKLPNGYQSVDPPRHSLATFKTELERTGAQAVFVLNMLTKRPERTETNLNNSLHLLRRARELGIEVSYVELGNEFYLGKTTRDASDDYVLAFPTARDYAKEARTWIRAIRHEFPDAKIAAVGADNRVGKPRRNTWNEAVLDELGGLTDALSIHPYVGSAQDDASLNVATLLEAPQVRLNNLQRWQWSKLPEDLSLWLSEYNLFERDLAVHGTWAHGLLNAAQTLSFLQEDRVELVHFHAGIGDAVFGAIFRTERGFGYDNSFAAPTNPPETLPFGLSASGQTLALVSRGLRGATSARRLDFGPNVFKLPAGSPSVVGWLLEGPGKKQTVLLNLSNREQTLDLSNLVTQGAFIQKSAAPGLRITGKRGEVNVTKGTAGPSLRLPPYSVTHVRRGT